MIFLLTKVLHPMGANKVDVTSEETLVIIAVLINILAFVLCGWLLMSVKKKG